MSAKNLRILITGAAGFIGSALAVRLTTLGHEVEAVDGLLGGLYSSKEKFERAERIQKEWGIIFEQKNLTLDFDINPKVDAVIHCAAMPGLGYSWENPEAYVSNNVLATIKLVKAMNRNQTPKLVFLSTSSVYGKVAVGDENSPPNPVSPYGETKLAAERMIAHLISPSLHFSIARLYSVYGPGQRPDMAYRRFIERALTGRPVTVHGDGLQSRSSTYIDDAVEGIILTLMHGKRGDVYNIGGGESVRLIDAVQAIYALADREPIISFEARVRGDQNTTLANFRKARDEFDFQPITRFQEGIEKQLEWQIMRGLL